MVGSVPSWVSRRLCRAGSSVDLEVQDAVEVTKVKTCICLSERPVSLSGHFSDNSQALNERQNCGEDNDILDDSWSVA